MTDHREKDLRHVWHPYTDMNRFEERPFPVMESAAGVTLTDTEGRKYLDGISSWWCVNLGHSHPDIVNSIALQLDRMQHSITGGMSHTGVIELSEALSEITPPGLNRFYYASDGASAVEAAIRIAVQYWWNLGNPCKKEIISLEGAYHGDTLGTVGLGFLPGFHRPVAHVVNRSRQAPAPRCFNCPFGLSRGSCSIECFRGMEELLEERAEHTAAVIAEPVCQGAAGIWIYPPEYVAALKKLCRRLGVLLILDEIAVGFGRTGKMFASDMAGISPDILVMGKSLTGGYLPMSAAGVTEEIFQSFRSSGGVDRTFYHGHTFSGNPLACAAALGAIGVFRRDGIPSPGKALEEGFSSLGEIPGVHRTGALGWMGRLEIEKRAGGAGAAGAVAEKALEKGLLIRPLGSVLYLWPPLVTPGAELEEMLSIFRDSLLSAL